VETAELLLGHGGLDARASGAIELPGPGGGRVRVLARLDLVAQLVVGGLELLLAVGVALLDLVRGDDALLDQPLRVQLADRRGLPGLGLPPGPPGGRVRPLRLGPAAVARR